MKHKCNTRKALITSIISLLLCMSMLVGTTFAWFTDSVSSTNNIITAGNLDVNLYWSTDGTSWAPVNAQTNIFKTETLWEPGHTEVVYLKVVNEGTLALKYNLNVNIVSENEGTNVAGETFKLSNYILYNVHEGVKTYANSAAARGDETGILLNTPYATADVLLQKGQAAEMTLVVFMPTTVGNEANYLINTDAPVINLGINLLANQQPKEEDSYGPNYDKDAGKVEIVATTADELLAAMENATPGDVINAAGVTLVPTNNVETTVKIPAGVTMKGVNFVPVGSAYLVICEGEDPVVLQNCNFVGVNMSTFVIGTNGCPDVTYKDCKFTGQIMPNAVENTDAVFTYESCTFGLPGGSGTVGYVNCMGGTHIFNNCTFDFTGGATFGSNQYVRWNSVHSYSESRYSTKVTLIDCTRINCTTTKYGPNSTITVQ